jgi:hypothetical protein
MNDALTSLHGLENLSSAESLFVADNERLRSVSELASLSRVSTLSIERNPGLPVCSAVALSSRVQAEFTSLADNDELATCP